MGGVIGELLPLATGVAISPLPIIAVILVLLTPRAGATGSGFLLGWAGGIVTAVVAFGALAEVTGLGAAGAPPAAVSWLTLALGVIMLVFAAHQGHTGLRQGDEPQLPGWMAAIDSIGPVKAAGLGMILAVANPKNLALMLAAGLTTSNAGLQPAGNVVAGAAFTVIAASTVAAPVLGYLVVKDAMAELLAKLKARLIRDNKTIMTVVLVVLSFVLIGKGLGGLL
ncbi:GAP family protein [Saccharopolyspora karakumensis]|uniref:GAP family protein n=1 Tax=Saccharopolyspora karakumensis TaxID=2530386 RepID=A0A4R5BYU8_9PSEU|nr:GAP family protein [Saccharopolyspora karakumensis]TDD90620.1 GAP family protein [Saccharopolyspora karakumensis]